jgi:hypothetical protein
LNRFILTVGAILVLGLGVIIGYSIVADSCQELSAIYGIDVLEAVAEGRNINCY